jgi:hypothetical protein
MWFDSFNRGVKCASAILAGWALVSIATPAGASTYSTSGGSASAIGDTIGSTFDQLILTADSGAIALGQIVLNPVTFIAGPNTFNAEVATGSITETLTVDGVTKNLIISYSNSISDADTITLSGGTLDFLGLTVTVLPLVLGPNPGGSMFGDLDAQVTPIPAALPLFAAGLGIIGFVANRRKRKDASAIVTA